MTINNTLKDIIRIPSGEENINQPEKHTFVAEYLWQIAGDTLLNQRHIYINKFF